VVLDEQFYLSHIGGFSPAWPCDLIGHPVVPWP
jgi:hypothetical protein